MKKAVGSAAAAEGSAAVGSPSEVRKITLQHKSTYQEPGGSGAASPWPLLQRSVVILSHQAAGDFDITWQAM